MDESREELRRLKEAGDAGVNELKAQLKVANDDIEKSRKTFADLELLRNEIAGLKEAKENVEAKGKEIAASLEKKETEWRDCDVRNKSLAERVTGFEREVAELKTENERFAEECETLRNKLKKSGSDNFTMIEHAQELEMKVLNLTQELQTALEKQGNTAIEEDKKLNPTSDTMTEKDDFVKNLPAERELLEAQVKALEKSAEKMKKELMEKEQDVRKLEFKLETIQMDLEETEEFQQRAEERVELLEQGVEKWKEKSKAFERETVETTKKLEEVIRDLEKERNSLSVIEIENARLEEKLAASLAKEERLRDNLQALEVEKERCDAEMKQALLQLNQARDEAIHWKNSYEKAKDDLSSIKNDLATVSAREKVARDKELELEKELAIEKETHAAERCEIVSQLEQAQNELKTTEKEFRRLEEETASLQSDVTAAKSELCLVKAKAAEKESELKLELERGAAEEEKRVADVYEIAVLLEKAQDAVACLQVSEKEMKENLTKLQSDYAAAVAREEEKKSELHRAEEKELDLRLRLENTEVALVAEKEKHALRDELLSAKLEQSEQTVKSLQDVKEGLESRLATAVRENDCAQKEKALLESWAEEKELELELKLEDAAVTLEAEKKRSVAEHNDMVSRLQQAQEEVKEAQRDVIDLQAKESKLAAVVADAELVRCELDEAKAKFRELELAFEAKAKHAASEYAAEREKHADEVQGLVLQLEQAQEDLRQGEKNTKELLENFSRLKEENGRLENDFNVALAGEEESQNKSEGLQKMKDVLEEKLKECELEFASAYAAEREKHADEVQSLALKLERAQEDLQQNEKNAKELLESLQALKEEKAQLENERTASRAREEISELAKFEAEEKLTELESKLEISLALEKDKHVAEKEELAKNLKEVVAEVEELTLTRKKCESLQEKTDSLENDLSAALRDKESAQNQLLLLESEADRKRDEIELKLSEEMEKHADENKRLIELLDVEEAKVREALVKGKTLEDAVRRAEIEAASFRDEIENLTVAKRELRIALTEEENAKIAALTDAESRAGELKKRLQQLEKETDACTEKIKELSLIIQEGEEEKKAFISELEEARLLVKTLRKNEEAKTKFIAEKDKEMARLETDNGSLKKELNLGIVEIKKLRAENEEINANLKNQIRYLQNRLTRLQQEYSVQEDLIQYKEKEFVEARTELEAELKRARKECQKSELDAEKFKQEKDDAEVMAKLMEEELEKKCKETEKPLAQKAALKKSGIPQLAKAKSTPLKSSNAMIPVQNPAPAKALAPQKTPKSVHWPDLPPNEDKTPEELLMIKYITPPLETPGKRGQQSGTGMSPASKRSRRGGNLTPDEKQSKLKYRDFKDGSDKPDCKTQ